MDSDYTQILYLEKKWSLETWSFQNVEEDDSDSTSKERRELQSNKFTWGVYDNNNSGVIYVQQNLNQWKDKCSFYKVSYLSNV